jgi:hypothetical protein
MSVKKRKSLDDVLSESDFVFGSPEPASKTISPEPPPETPTPKPSPVKESNLMIKLQIPEKEATVRFTVDMSESLHRKLSVLAAKTGRKKVDIVRILLEEGLKDVEI